MKQRWKNFRYRLEAIAMRGVAATIPRLPRSWLLRLAKCAGALFYRFDARSRRVAQENLRAAFPGLSERRRDLIARGAARNFARTFLDLFWARNLTAANYQRHCAMVGFEEVLASRTRANGSILCCAHFGNFEWASLVTGFAGLPTLIVAQEFKNAGLDAIFNGARAISGHRILPRTQAMLKMLRAVKRGGSAGLLVDLTLPPEMPSAALRAFGGLRICATILHAILNERSGVPITPVSALPRHDGSYRVTFHPPMEFSTGASRAEIAQAVWDCHESVIRRRPSLWLWSYKHFRYRPVHPEREYPWYAMEHPAFERLVQEAPPVGA
ncbi:hypothetical protein AYO41_00530 [Verrucomicrobia bacterium SCGC AG-212-E04]|nr:hypothetical protein AYO41_00530 [Verrucomicrobia bacterium SCGC AG-212-E04]